MMLYFQVASVTADAADATVDPDNPTAACEQTPPEQVSPWDSKLTDEPPALTGTVASCRSPSARGEGSNFLLMSVFRK